MKRSFFEPKTWLVVLVPLLISLFFIPMLLLGKVPIPADSLLGLYHPFRDNQFDGYNPYKFPIKNPLITDPVLQTYPWRYRAIDNLKNGNWPLWNPYSFAGGPLAANIQSAPFSVFNILFFIFDFKLAWSIQIILVPILGGIFMYLFLSSLNLSKTAAIFGSVVLPFSGFYLSWLTWGTVASTAIWLPLILFCINRLFSKIFWHFFLILSFATSQTIFAGHWQTALYVFLASFIYLATKVPTAKTKTAISISLVAIVIGIVVSSIQVLPALEFLKLSARNLDQGFYPGRADWFLPIQHLIQLVAPDYFGNPTTANYWGVWNWAEFSSYLSIGALALAVFAAFKNSKNSRFFIVLAVLALGLALKNPLSQIPYVLNIPFLSSIQPSRIIFLLNFALAGLAALGMEKLISGKSKAPLVVGIMILLVLSVIGSYTYLVKDQFPVAGHLDSASIALRNLILPAIAAIAMLAILLASRIFKLKTNVLVVLIFALTMAELYRNAFKFTPFSKPEWIFPQTKTFQFLSSQEKPFRVMTTDRRILHPNIGTVYGIESVDGYDPLYLADYGRLVSVWQSQNPAAASVSFNRILTPQKYDSQITDLLNVKYVLSFDEFNSPDLVKVFEEGETKIYENKKVLPRAFFVKEIAKFNSPEEELAKILDKNTNLLQTATSLYDNFAKQEFTSSVKVEKYTDQSVILSTNTDKEAPLIVANVNYPGWQAKIDGRQVPIGKVNFMFQSVIVPAGSHRVEFQFRPQSFYNGLYLSIAGIMAMIIMSLYLWRKKFQ